MMTFVDMLNIEVKEFEQVVQESLYDKFDYDRLEELHEDVKSVKADTVNFEAKITKMMQELQSAKERLQETDELLERVL